MGSGSSALQAQAGTAEFKHTRNSQNAGNMHWQSEACRVFAIQAVLSTRKSIFFLRQKRNHMQRFLPQLHGLLRCKQHRCSHLTLTTTLLPLTSGVICMSLLAMAAGTARA